MKLSSHLRPFLKGTLCTALVLASAASLLYAKPVPSNLGYGLDKLVESKLAIQQAAARGPRALAAATRYNGYATEEAASYAAEAITEESTGRVTVDITLRGTRSMDDVTAQLAAQVPSFSVVARDGSYRGVGIIEAWISVEDVATVAKMEGVRAVFLALKPQLDSVIAIDPQSYSPTRIVPALREVARATKTVEPYVTPGQVLKKIGTTFDQGVTQHRVDKINQLYNPSAPVNYDGTGISIGALSDSYNTRTLAPHADTGVANFDLPGAVGNPINSQPVVVLKDQATAGTDEGRGMLEIVHKMAPRARLAYATGVDGEVAFANYVRALAGLPGFTFDPSIQQGFKADVIVDDISYGGEPFYGESIIGGGIDDVAAAGVSYFSSAGNNIGTNAYESFLRIIPADSNALVGTNINLTGVPTNLYAGGFHNFNPNPGQQDIAALWNMPTGSPGATEMQWDDPYDIRDPILNQPAIYSNSGTIDNTTTTVNFNDIPVFNQGVGYVINTKGTSGDIDTVVMLIDPDGNTVVNQDTGVDETVYFYAPRSGQYRITVGRYSTTIGSFTITINTTQTPASVTTDLNLLVFRADTGAYLGTKSLTTDNLANNRPVELGSSSTVSSPTGQTQLQFVIARANNPTAPQLPTRVRISTRGNGAAGIGPAEYFSYNATTTKGHATAKGGNGVAAYSPFRPNVPESFTSPGPATILFDKNANRLAVPDIRLNPTVAAIDAANTSFFGSDTNRDIDVNPNFSGTSAAAPHAAALAGLVLQAKGGSGSVTPTQMRTMLQRSAFPHDLDPSYASGTARATNGGKITITINSDNSANVNTGRNDPNSIAVSYVGPGSLASLTFNPSGTATDGGNVTGGNNGYTDDAGTTPPNGTITYFANYFPGLVFLPATKGFTLGNLTGLTAGDITAPTNASPYTGFSNLAPAPANGTSQFWTMSLGFPTGNFTGGKVLRFTVGRGTAHGPQVSNSTGPTGGSVLDFPLADLFGGGVFIPEGTVVQDGMKFSGTITGGGVFEGNIRNRIGSGYTPVDGYGVINIESAVNQPLP